MCQRKPGPRCSGHVRTELDAAQQAVTDLQAARLAAAEAGEVSGAQVLTSDLIKARVKVDVLQAQFDETPAGQEALSEALAQDMAGDKRARLEGRKTAAADRRARQVEALRLSEAGEERRANAVLRWGTQSAWMADSDIADRDPASVVALGETAHLVSFHARDDIQYDYAGQGAAVWSGDVTVEQRLRDRGDGTFEVAEPHPDWTDRRMVVTPGPDRFVARYDEMSDDGSLAKPDVPADVWAAEFKDESVEEVMESNRYFNDASRDLALDWSIGKQEVIDRGPTREKFLRTVLSFEGIRDP